MTRMLVEAQGIGTAVSPLVHSEEVLGNKAFFRRLSIRSGAQVIPVPVLSGNSFRGMWRDLLAMHLVNTLNISHLSALSFTAFFSGGSLTGGGEELADLLYRHFPALSLMGFSMGGRMFASRLALDFAVPLADETRRYATDAYPGLSLDGPTVPVNAVTGTTMMTRKDDESKAILIELEIDTSDQDANPTQMIYHVEYIVPGTQIVHGFRSVYPISPLEFGALLTALELSGQRTFGGMGSKGFGRIDWTYHLTLRSRLDEPAAPPVTLKVGTQTEIPPELAVYQTQYQEHLTALRSTITSDAALSNVIRFADAGDE